MDDTANTSNQSGQILLEDDCVSNIELTECVFLILYSSITVVALVGNFVVCYIIITEKMLQSVTNLFLLNIAVADIMKTLILVPFSFIPNLILAYWPFGSFMCPFVLYAQIVTVFASAFTLVAMSADRYAAIIYPLRPKLTHKGAVCICGAVWLIAFIVPIPTAITGKVQIAFENRTGVCQKGRCYEDMDERLRSPYSLFIMLLQYFIPLLVLTLTYSRIAYMIWIKIIPGESVQRQDERQASSKRKMVKMMIVVVLLYAICWLPLHTLQLATDENPEIFINVKNIRYMWITCEVISASHSCYNPFVYFWMNRKFRSAFRNFFKKCFCCLRIGRFKYGDIPLSRQTSMTTTVKFARQSCSGRRKLYSHPSLSNHSNEKA
ncbi:RYamide receptor-like [Saccostrea cucullata]|uniref:RYamide receptor-like n=1 Tax=Saccostrea cuccullata TaxID=36930 RepID=UPI002ED4BE45